MASSDLIAATPCFLRLPCRLRGDGVLPLIVSLEEHSWETTINLPLPSSVAGGFPFWGAHPFSLFGGAPLPLSGARFPPLRVRVSLPATYLLSMFPPSRVRAPFIFFTLWDRAFSLSGTLPPPGTHFPFRLHAFSLHFPHFPPSRYMLLFFYFFPFWDRTFPFWVRSLWIPSPPAFTFLLRLAILVGILDFNKHIPAFNI